MYRGIVCISPNHFDFKDFEHVDSLSSLISSESERNCLTYLFNL